MQPPGIQVIQVDGANDSDSEDDDDDDDDEDDLDDDKKDKSQDGLDDPDLDVSIVQSFSHCNYSDLPSLLGECLLTTCSLLLHDNISPSH